MGGKSEDEGDQSLFLRLLDEITEEFLMAKVEAVEVPDGDHGSARESRTFVESAEDVHGFR
jgi:hypothetical protein